MKHQILFITLIIPFHFLAQQQTATFTIVPNPFDKDEEITITVSGVDPTIWNADEPNNIYLWAWYLDNNGNYVADSPTNGEWTNSNETQKMTNNGDGTYSYTLVPTDLYGASNIGQMGMLVKAKDGSGDKKSQDFIVSVGIVNITIISPTSDTIVESGGNLNISASLSFEGLTQSGDFEVYINDVLKSSGSGFPNFSTTIMNITEGGEVRVVGTPTGESVSGEAIFNLTIAPTVIEEEIPIGLVEGINFDKSDNSKATLVLNAPSKDFIYVAGSFNNFSPGSEYLMKKDVGSNLFWLELQGLTVGIVETFQYWVYDMDPIANSPIMVKVADPYSTLVLSPYDDPTIPSSSYPWMPTYPSGQQFEVSVLETGQSEYDWQISEFISVKEEDLIVYEVLVRDFDTDRNYQELIDKVSYFKSLNVNAIELLPIMEFEGNYSWGYNTSFHMALDKFYGSKTKFKELVDTFHENGIAVILDLALNHAFGRNPMVRMWMSDPDGDGFGSPTTQNPYFNTEAKHSYNVGYDFNHQSELTQNYTKRVIEYWISEFHIDGFRWDLTKGFTQNCSSGDEDCTNAYQQDRIDILKEYVDYAWSIDESHYAIFEHLGTSAEEQEWANYRLDEGKGVMMWGKMTDPYNQLTMGYTEGSNIDGMGHKSRGFNGKRLIGYAESHDEERLMYKNITFGNSSNPSHDVKDLDTALSRMSALGAVTLLIPGPKMIWHFGELGMFNSIFTCFDGAVNTNYDSIDGDCKLDTKPQPQWTENWMDDPDRRQIYNDWMRMAELKVNEDVFEGDYTIDSGDLTPRIHVFDNSLAVTELKDAVILANFDVVSQNVSGNFPYAGLWYDLMDDTGTSFITVTDTSSPITIEAGQFRIFGNQSSLTLGTEEFKDSILSVYPNPVSSKFSINARLSSVQIFGLTGKLYKEFKGDFVIGHEFDIQELSQSLYIIKVEDEDGKSFNSKLIKI